MRIIKRIIFHVLLALRGIVLGISRLFAILFFIGAFLIFFVHDFHNIPVIGKVMVATFAIIFTLINWFYDDLIFYFEPDNIDITLYR